MSLELLGITVLWVFLYGYLIVASIDFGAGFFHYYSRITNRHEQVNGVIQRYLSPVWEVTNVFLIFFMVGMIGFFPDVAFYYGTALLIPGSVAVVLLAIRGSYYAFGTYVSKDNRWYMFLYGATGLLIPASLSTVLTISEGGFLELREGRVVFLAKELLMSPYAWSVVALAIVSVLFISACFLTYYANQAGDRGATDILRNYALAWSAPTILTSVFVFILLQHHNPAHFAGMVERLPLFAVSTLFYLIAVWLMWSRRFYGFAFVCVMLQFGFAFFGYGASHLPYLLYPYITIYDHFTSPQMAAALIAAFILGLLLLIPSLYLLMRLFLFNGDYVRGKWAK